MKFRMYFIGLVLGLVLFGCGETRDVGKAKEIEKIAQSEVIQIEKTPRDTQVVKTIMREVDGKMVELRLDGKLVKHFENLDWGNVVEEVGKGVVIYRKTFHPKYDKRDVAIPIYEKIEFFNENYKFLNVFKIRENNPYLHLTKLEEGIQIKENYGDAEGTIVIPKTAKKNYEKIQEKHLRSHVEYENGFTKIIYTTKSVAKYGRIVGTSTTLIILDKSGNKILEKEKKGNVSTPALSLDGKYVMFSILNVQTTTNAGLKNQREGFEIWNTEKNVMIYQEINENPDMWISEPVADDKSGIIRIEYTFPNSRIIGQKEIAFDTESKILYSRIFSVKEWEEISINWFSKYNDDYTKLLQYFDFDKKIISDE